MALAHPIKNTDKDYQCVACGAHHVSVIREGDNPRLKCNACNFMFNGSDSIAAQEAGAIKPSSPEALKEAEEAKGENLLSDLQPLRPVSSIKASQGVWELPSRPAFVFMAKDKSAWEFCARKDFDKIAIKWSQGSTFDVYELSKIKLGVKVIKG